MATDELLQGEARERPRMAIAAGVAALFTLLAPVVGMVAFRDQPDNLPASTLFREEHLLALVLSALCSVVALLALTLLLDFLFRATRARNEQMPAVLRPLPLAGGLSLAALTIAFLVISAVEASQFATGGSQTFDEARAVTDYGALRYLGLVAQMAVAFALVMISLNAMRVGLLPRFLGYLGVISGVLFVIPLFGGFPIVQLYWLGAVGVLLAGRMRDGLPLAWRTGRAEPWPSPQEMREQRVREAEARKGRAAGAQEPDGPGAGEPAGPPPNRVKRKRRR